MKNYQRTIIACFAGYIVQAIINNFAPLLFLTFQTQYQIPLSQITLLVTFNFLTQLGVDFAAIFLSIGLVIVSRLSRRIFCGCRIDWVGCFSTYLSDPFTGLLAAVFLYAIGGGLLEVLVSPIVEACPTPNKRKP